MYHSFIHISQIRQAKSPGLQVHSQLWWYQRLGAPNLKLKPKPCRTLGPKPDLPMTLSGTTPLEASWSDTPSGNELNPTPVVVIYDPLNKCSGVPL